MYLEAWTSGHSGPSRPRGGPNRLKRDSGLLAERGEVEVDDLASHQPITERHYVGEGDGERTSAGREAQPVTAAGSMKRSPHDDGVVPDRHPIVRWGKIGERAEELHLVEGADRIEAFPSQTEGVRRTRRPRQRSVVCVPFRRSLCHSWMS